MSHHTETTEHPSGRKDVRIEVDMLDVNATDEATTKAKEVIEGTIFPKLANAKVLVVVIHKPTNQHAQQIVKAHEVRKYAEAAVKAHIDAALRGDDRYHKSEYVIVEHHIDNGTVQVTTL